MYAYNGKHKSQTIEASKKGLSSVLEGKTKEMREYPAVH